MDAEAEAALRPERVIAHVENGAAGGMGLAEKPVDPRAAAMAAAIAAHYPGSARVVLFYGSCLRETQLDGLMLDFYLIVSDYGDAFPKRWMALANRLIPPNVFPFQAGGFRKDGRAVLAGAAAGMVLIGADQRLDDDGRQVVAPADGVGMLGAGRAQDAHQCDIADGP